MKHRIISQSGFNERPTVQYVINAEKGRRLAKQMSRVIFSGPVTFIRWDGSRFRKTIYVDGQPQSKRGLK